MSLFDGTGVALVTPCDGEKILFSEAEKLLSYVIGGGANALIALGTTGEASTLTESQKRDFVRFVRRFTDLPLIVGTGSNDTETVVKNCLAAQEDGADAFLIVTPFYNKCTQEGAYLHYKYIAERVSKPIIVYNVPGRTGFDLLPETMAKIAHVPGVIAIKEASGNVVRAAKCLHYGVEVFSGDDALTVPSMCLGAKGIISVAANVAPRLVSKMTELALSDKLLEAGKIQLKLLPLIDALFCEVNPIPVRAAMELLGINLGKPRLPMTELSEGNRAKLKTIMEELELI